MLLVLFTLIFFILYFCSFCSLLVESWTISFPFLFSVFFFVLRYCRWWSRINPRMLFYSQFTIKYIFIFYPLSTQHQIKYFCIFFPAFAFCFFFLFLAHEISLIFLSHFFFVIKFVFLCIPRNHNLITIHINFNIYLTITDIIPLSGCINR